MAKTPKNRIVTAVGVAGSAASTARNPSLATAIEEAMSAAITAANAKGIHDPDKVRAAMLKARDKVKERAAIDDRKAAREAKRNGR